MTSPETSNNTLYDTVYRKLKQAVYYNSDLFLKKKLALFESEFEEKDKLLEIFQCIASPARSISNELEEVINGWINQISFYVLPKSVSPHPNKEAIDKAEKNEKYALSNVISSATYHWQGLNYYIDMPIPLHMLDVLWIMKVGAYLDEELGDCCFGNRVHENLCERKNEDTSSHLMKIYGKQYTFWQNKALDLANKAIDNNEIVDILTLDFKQFYYHIEGDFGEIEAHITKKSEEASFKGNLQTNLFLTKMLLQIHEKYFEVVKNYVSVTNRTIKERQINKFLPIGLFSSGILANWHLKEFDKAVIKDVSPRYYGRYVDDCIFVFARTQYNAKDKVNHNDSPSKEEIIKKYLVETGLLSEQKNRDQQITIDGTTLDKSDEDKSERIDDKEYRLNDNRYTTSRITVQDNKVMLYHVDPNHSTAILRLFKKKIKENASVFQYLPEDSILETLDTGMHQLVFSDGSTNKLRNLQKLVVDDSKLGVVLSKQISHISLCSKPIEKIGVLTKNMFNDLRGNNYLAYIRVWEKMFSILLFSKKQEQEDELFAVSEELLEHINHLKPSDDFCLDKDKKVKIKKSEKIILNELSGKIQYALQKYLQYSMFQPLSLFDGESRYKFAKKISSILEKYLPSNHNDSSEALIINSIIDLFRAANLFPQHYVIYPLLNYLKDYDGDLFDVDIFNTDSLKNLELDPHKLDTTPRFIHLYEYQLFFALKNLKSEKHLTECSNSGCPNSDSPLCCYLQKANSDFGLRTYQTWGSQYDPHVKVTPYPYIKEEVNSKPVSPTKIEIKSDDKPLKKIRVGLVNLRITEKNLRQSFEPLEMPPNISLERWLLISQALNTAVRDKCDLVIFPECSIPHRWLPKLTHWSKQHQIGLVFGLEYIYNTKCPNTSSSDNTSSEKCIAFNMTAALLPFQINDKYKSCCVSLRIKNHYGPQEEKELNMCGYSLPDLGTSTYHLYNWRGNQFTIYNCFELADIQHRAIFRSELDFLIACSVNRDVNYFMDILESVVRDIHCYVIYSNTSEYGCSRIIQPKKHEERNIGQIGGGTNCTLLAGDLDIDALRKFQSHQYDETDNSFKPLPPGFDIKKVIERSVE